LGDEGCVFREDGGRDSRREKKVNEEMSHSGYEE